MPTDDDYREAMVWRGRLSAIPVSTDSVMGYFAWQRKGQKGERSAAFCAVVEMGTAGRAALSASLILRRSKRAR